MNSPIERSVIKSTINPNDYLAEKLGGDFRSYRSAWLRAEAGQRPPTPLHLDVDVTCACNLSCPMCPAGSTRHSFPNFIKGRRLAEELYQKALREAESFNLPSIRLGMTGEPLLIDDIHQWVAEAKAAKIIDISLITNGQLLDEGLIPKLIKSGLVRLMVSIDAATAETYARSRPGGDWQRLMSNLEAFIKIRAELGRGLPLLRLSFVEMNFNYLEKELFVEKFGPLADYLSIQRYQNIFKQADTDFAPPKAEKKAPAKVENPGQCLEPLTRLALLADGSLFPCCSDFARLAPLGHLAETTLLTVWNSEKAKSLCAKNFYLHEPCQSCLA